MAAWVAVATSLMAVHALYRPASASPSPAPLARWASGWSVLCGVGLRAGLPCSRRLRVRVGARAGLPGGAPAAGAAAGDRRVARGRRSRGGGACRSPMPGRPGVHPARPAVPVDGVVAGSSAVDLQLVTGEAIPRGCGPRDEVVGGSLNLNRRAGGGGHPGRRADLPAAGSPPGGRGHGHEAKHPAAGGPGVAGLRAGCVCVGRHRRTIRDTRAAGRGRRA